MDDPMDWEGHSTAQVHAAPQVQCPYNAAAEAASSSVSPFGNAQSAAAAFNPGMPFHQPHGQSQALWNIMQQQQQQQNEGYHQGAGSRFPVYPPPPNVFGRAPGAVGFGSMDGQEQSHSASLTGRQSRFEAPRLSTQRGGPYQAGAQQSAAPTATNGLSGGSHSLAPSTASEMPPNHNAILGRRSGSTNDNSHENGPTPLVTPPRPHLPPPNSVYHDYYYQPNLPFPPQPRFSGSPSFGHQNSSTPMSSHPPQPRDRPFMRSEPGPGSHPPHRDLFYDAFRTVPHPDGESDEDSSLDSQTNEDASRREVLPESRAPFRHPHDSVRLSSDARRSLPFDGEQHELALERARAARRAAAISVKMVASSSALASLEKVDLAGLKGDDRNCIICYNDFGVQNPDGFVESPVRLPKCKHIFGDRCLKQWLQDSDSCPYCRDKLPSEPKRNKPEDVRRLLAQAHAVHAAQGQPLQLINYPWPSDPTARMHPAYSGLEQQQRHQPHPPHHRSFRHTDDVHDIIHAMQYRSTRRHPEETDEFLARLNRHEDYNWNDPSSQTSPGHFARSMPDYDGRRRFRGSRNSTSRAAPQIASRPNGQSSTRSTRNSNPSSSSRTPIHSSTPSFDENATSQRRSVTPHPTLVGLPGWAGQQQSSPNASERSSTLATERSSPSEPNGVHRDVLGRHTSSGGIAMTTAPLERSWSEANNASVEPFNRWVNSGRPASATFINEMPQSRLHQFENGISSAENPIQSNIFAPSYMISPPNTELQGGYTGRH